jgi:S-adenosylmethionine synthetase
MKKIVTCESVTEGHPDKLCDFISDSILDAFLEQDPKSRVGCECVAGKNVIFVTGEITSNGVVNIQEVVRNAIKEIGYFGDVDIDYKTCEVIVNISKQSPDIALGTNDEVGGAGDQGMMFGYACNDNDKYLPTAMIILQELSREYDKLIRKDNRFKPDGKAQITGVYDNDMKLLSIKDFTISYQNTELERNETDKIIKDICNKICKKYNIKVENYLINPTGRFEIGGFEGDAGLTGRKIVVDSYQSFAKVGGGAFSGKDPSKVDRSAAYKARELAVRYLKEYDLRWCQIEISYAIGIKKPLSIYIDSDKGYIEPEESLYTECEPKNIIKDLDLLNKCYFDTAKFGHFE